MLGWLKRVLWPCRLSHHRELREFTQRMREARMFGIEQQRASRVAQRSIQPTRDFSDTLAVPPVWRKEGGRND